MESTPEQSCDMLSTIFTQLDRNFIFRTLKENSYQVEATMDALFSLQDDRCLESHSLIDKRTKSPPKLSVSTKPISSSLQSSYINSRNDDSPKPPKPPSYRGSKFHLPNNFLRIPGWERRHKDAIQKKDFMTLFADPVFLREVEREFGADFESVLRDHLRVVQLRMAEDLEKSIAIKSGNAPPPAAPRMPSIRNPTTNPTEWSNTDSEMDVTLSIGQAIDDGLTSVQARFQDLLGRFEFDFGFSDTIAEPEQEALLPPAPRNASSSDDPQYSREIDRLL